LEVANLLKEYPECFAAVAAHQRLLIERSFYMLDFNSLTHKAESNRMWADEDFLSGLYSSMPTLV
jgi:hypothetical protein